MRSAPAWIAWALIVFGAMNVYAPPDPNLLGASLAASKAERAPGLAHLLVLQRDDGDTRRYFAYARAMLGLPLDSFYLRRDAEGRTASRDEHVLLQPEHPLLPWRDFTVEYPPGMLVAAVLPALIATDFPTYHFLFSLFMGLLLTLTAWLCASSAEAISPGAGQRALWLALGFVAALGVVSLRRYDPLVAVTIAAAMRAMVAGRAARSGWWLGLATAAKGTPLLLAPVGALYWAREGQTRALTRAAIAGALTLALAAAIYALVAGPNARDALTYHLDRPIQVESPYGAALLLADLVSPGIAKVTSNHGSENVESALEPALRPVSTALILAAAIAILAWFWRTLGRADDETARARALLAAATAMLVAYIALGKVFSPQYLVWVLPCGVAAAALSSERSRVLLIGAALLTQIEFPFVYFLDAPGSWQILAAVALARDAVLIAAAASLMADASFPLPALRGEGLGVGRS